MTYITWPPSTFPLAFHSRSSMPLLSASLDLYITTSIVIAIPWLILTFNHKPARPRHNDHLPHEEPWLRPYINIFLLLHSLYILHKLIVSPPPNMFTSLDIPLSTSTDKIRAILTQYSGTGDLPAPLETLLKRLANFDMRGLFVRQALVIYTVESLASLTDFQKQIRTDCPPNMRILHNVRRIRLLRAPPADSGVYT